MRRAHVTVVASVLCAALVIVACRTVGKAVEGVGQATGLKSLEALGRVIQSGEDLTPSEQHYVGRSVAANVIARYGVDESSGLAKFIERVGQVLVDLNPQIEPTFKGYHFSILNAEMVQAVSAPGGFVFVSRGALDLAQTEDEIAAVLAHEIAHVHLKHPLGAINANRWKELASGVAVDISKDSGPKTMQAFTGAVGDIGDAVENVGYGQGKEEDADKLAIELLKGAGYHEEALSVYLARLGKVNDKGGLLSTHPAPATRIEYLALPTEFRTDPTLEGRTTRFKTAKGA
ncbi:MAG: M48 family metallopeptidase [Planctomycetota bacterium]